MLREPTVAGIGQLAAMQTRGAVIWGRPPCSGPARPEHRPAAASQRSLQVCIASLPLQSSLMSKTYLKSDPFNGGGQRPDPDRLRHQPRRRRELSRHLHGARDSRERSVRLHRPRGRGRTGADRRRARSEDEGEAQGRDLRRARRRPRLRRVLPRDCARLRLVLAVPRSHRTPRRRPGRARQGLGGSNLRSDSARGLARMRWHVWVVLIAGSTGSALRAVRPPNLHITPGVRRDLVYAASATGSLYRSPLAIIAQPIRAILLASAMAATFVGRRANNAASQGRCPLPWILA